MGCQWGVGWAGLWKNLSPRICGSTSEVDKMRYNRPKVENGPEYCISSGHFEHTSSWPLFCRKLPAVNTRLCWRSSSHACARGAQILIKICSLIFLLVSFHMFFPISTDLYVHKKRVGRLGQTVRLNPNKRRPRESCRPYPKNYRLIYQICVLSFHVACGDRYLEIRVLGHALHVYKTILRSDPTACPPSDSPLFCLMLSTCTRHPRQQRSGEGE